MSRKPNAPVWTVLGAVVLSLSLLHSGGTARAGDAMSLAQKGKLAPDFTSLSTTGKPFSLSDQAGRPVLLTFWSDWCSLEKTELSFLREVKQHYPDVGIVIVDSEEGTPSIRSLAHIRRSLDEWGVDASVLIDWGQEVTRLYNVEALPTSLVLDPAGRIVYREANYYKGAYEEVMASLSRVNAVSLVQ